MLLSKAMLAHSSESLHHKPLESSFFDKEGREQVSPPQFDLETDNRN